MSKGEVKTWLVIKPVWENGNISEWMAVAIVTAITKTKALKIGRGEYGIDIDVEETMPLAKMVREGRFVR